MGATAAFIWTFAPVAIGAVIAIVFDAAARPAAAATASSVGLAVGGVIGIIAGWTVVPGAVFGVMLAGRAFSTLPGAIFLLAALATFTLPDAEADGSRAGSLAVLLSLGALGAGVTASTMDLVSLLLALAITAVTGYAVVASSRTRRSSEASVKYLVQGSVATGLGLLGVAILMSMGAGSARYESLLDRLPEVGAASPALAGVLLLVAALAFKSGAAPFHAWAPDAYESAPEVGSAFLAAGPKAAALFALALIGAALGPAGAGENAPLGTLGGDVFPVIAVLGMLSVLVGSFTGLRQSSFTRMLGYSGVAQVGYGLIAAAAVRPSSSAVFVVTYAIGVACAFLGATAVRIARPGWDGSIDGMAGFGHSEPLPAAVTALSLVSLAGIPPLIGFWGKFEAVGAAATSAVALLAQGETGYGATYAIAACVIVVGSVVSLGYYGRVIKAMYFEDAPLGDQATDGVRAGRLRFSQFALALMLVAGGATPLITGMSRAVTGFLLN